MPHQRQVDTSPATCGDNPAAEETAAERVVAAVERAGVRLASRAV